MTETHRTGGAIAIRESSRPAFRARLVRAVTIALAALVAAMLVTDAVVLFVAAGNRMGLRWASAPEAVAWTAGVEAVMP